MYPLNLPEEYKCVRTTSSDHMSWVFFILRELVEAKIITSGEFTRLTISLEGYGLEN
jgi:hypothetical protein